jgi:oxygen-independent coproporphyrinogen-3 oxidase
MPTKVNEPLISSLYVHVPFCVRKCAYCAFYSEPGSGAEVNRYVRALIAEMEMVAAELKPQTVFFGGGTPSILNWRQWEAVFKAMERLGLLGAAEWTVECNPATVSADKARLLRDWGVNRVSMGAQSFDPGLLERLGRVHSREMIFKSFDVLRAAGFDNVNLDLMFAIPGQTMEIWRATLAEAAALGSEHLACYEVIYEEDTALFAQLRAGKIPPDEDLACAMYDALLTAADAAGLEQYEVANFARRDGGRGELPERACRHNVNYWRGGWFHGLGPGAAGYAGGRRTSNIADTRLYCRQLERGIRPVAASEQLPPLARAGELAAFGLRMTAGWPLAQFRERTGFDLKQEWAAEIERMIQLGYGRLDGERFQLTRQGLRFADWAGAEFLRS